MDFPTNLDAVMDRLDRFDPIEYAKTRNYLSGSVSYLSPYLSRGFITIPHVIARLEQRGFSFAEMEKFVQELAWREFYTRTWFQLGDKIFQDIRHAQEGVVHRGILSAFLKAQTGIHIIDEQLLNFYQTGYLHNHVRMYLAAIACNIAKYHWSKPASWMYYHLLDGDLASNALSWQWCAGTFSSKKYFANQENINKYTGSSQRETFLDHEYESFTQLPIPESLKNHQQELPAFKAPKTNFPTIRSQLPTYIYTHYTLDPLFHANEKANRILVLEPSHFERHPISPKSLQFILDLAAEIPDLQVYYGDYADLQVNGIFRDHPINQHFEGIREPFPFIRENIVGEFPSFFSFWNQLKKHL